MSHNNLKNFQDQQINEQKSQQSEVKIRQLDINKKSCRICLCHQNQSLFELINPCRCSGSLKYVHIKCYQQWIIYVYEKLQTSQDRQIMQTLGFQCEICNSIVKVQFKFERQLVTKQQFKKICENSIPLTITIIVFFMIAIAAFSFLIYFANYTKQQFYKKDGSQAVFTILAILVIIVFFSAGLLFFISNYIWIRKIKIDKIYLHNTIR